MWHSIRANVFYSVIIIFFLLIQLAKTPLSIKIQDVHRLENYCHTHHTICLKFWWDKSFTSLTMLGLASLKQKPVPALESKKVILNCCQFSVAFVAIIN